MIGVVMFYALWRVNMDVVVNLGVALDERGEGYEGPEELPIVLKLEA
jgi:hypothetical protein